MQFAGCQFDPIWKETYISYVLRPRAAAVGSHNEAHLWCVLGLTAGASHWELTSWVMRHDLPRILSSEHIDEYNILDIKCSG